jgi:predicted nucleic acid-binding protein
MLADTSIWIDHFRKADGQFSALLVRRGIVLHPFVLGELALGHAIALRRLVNSLNDLAQALVADHREVYDLIARKRLSGSGIGYVDAHLIASTLIMPEVQLWTRDKKLREVAERLSIAATSLD